MRLTVVRHGETVENAQKIHMGHGPGHLSKIGKDQAKKLGEALKKRKFDFIYCSDLKRCKDTLKEISKYHQHIPVIFTEQLRERNMGIYEGRPTDNLKKAAKRFAKHPVYFRPRGGESPIDQKDRIKKFLIYIQKHHPKDSVLFVTHAGVLRAVTSVVEKKPMPKLFKEVKFHNTAICEYEIVGKKVKVLAFNDARHLDK